MAGGGNPNYGTGGYGMPLGVTRQQTQQIQANAPNFNPGSLPSGLPDPAQLVDMLGRLGINTTGMPYAVGSAQGGAAIDNGVTGVTGSTTIGLGPGGPGNPPALSGAGAGALPPFLGVGKYRGRGPGGEGADYYGWPDQILNAQTQFPPPPFQKGGQPYKIL